METAKQIVTDGKHRGMLLNLRAMDRVIAEHMGKQHATLAERYTATMDARVRGAYVRSGLYTQQLQMTRTEYTWRAIKALHARGRGISNVFTIYTEKTFELVRQDAGQELYAGTDQEHYAIEQPAATPLYTLKAFCDSLQMLKDIWDTHIRNVGKPPNMVDLIMALRHDLHPMILCGYEPFSSFWHRYAKQLDMHTSQMKTRSEVMEWLSTAYGTSKNIRKFHDTLYAHPASAWWLQQLDVNDLSIGALRDVRVQLMKRRAA